MQRFEQRLTEQQAGQQAEQAAWAGARRRLEQAVADAGAQLEADKQQAQVRPPLACLRLQDAILTFISIAAL